MKNKISFILFLFLLYICFIPVLFTQTIPSPSGYFTDATNTLAGIEEQMESLALELKNKTGCEIGILVVNDLSGYTVEEFALKAFNQWGVGEESTDNGVLLLLAIKDRKARIEVGYGLEFLLTDAKAGNFLVEYAVPYFKNDDWAQGLTVTTQALTQFIINNYNPDAESVTEMRETAHDNETDSITYSQTDTSFTIESILLFFFKKGIHYYILIALFIFNIILHFSRRFLILPVLAGEIAAGLLLFIITYIFIDDADYRTLNIVVYIGAGVLYFLQYVNSKNHECPKCRKYLTITSRTLTSATYTSSGRGRRDYNCPFCGYHKSKYYTIPRKTRSSSSSGGYSSGGGYSSSSSSSSSSSFGGGSSGGGGASVGF